MERRNFLRFGGFAAVSVATLSGCGGGSSSPAPATASPAAGGGGWKFPQSVASGDPRPDSVVLWTRCVPTSADDVLTSTTPAFGIRLLVSSGDHAAKLGTNQALASELVLDVLQDVKPEFDHTVRHKVTGLKPASVYYYQFAAGDVRSNVGRFKTAPAQDADVAQLRFAMLTCQDWSVNHWGAYTEILKEDLDLVLHLGDYIYETVGASFQTGAVESRHTALKLPDGSPLGAAKGGGTYATTTADYRYLYKMYRTDSRLQAVHERFPMVAIWDDHEFSDDCWQDAETYDEGSFNASTGVANNTRQTARRRSANQAWFEFMPADVVFAPDNTSPQNLKIYRDLVWGKLAHFVMTDERLYRADHMVPEAYPNPATGQPLGSTGSRYFVPQALSFNFERVRMNAANPGIDAVSMLGGTQRQWWMDTMAASKATWKLWGNEVVLQRMGLDGTAAIATLLALQSVSTLATSIGNTAGQMAGNVLAAAIVVAAMTAGAAQGTAAGAVTPMLTADATAGNVAAAGVAAGLSATQAGLAAQAMAAAKAAAAGGATLQASAAAQVIAMGHIKPDVIAKGASSSFVQASGKAAALSPYFMRFLINADGWDGYDAERRMLMTHLLDKGIRNVVGLTGDIHAFFCSEVRQTFDNADSPVAMVDFVTAGISSDSFFTYLNDAATAMSADLATITGYPLTIPVTGLGSVSLTLNLLDYTMAKAAPSLDSLAEQVRVRLRSALGAKGVPEAQLDATTTAVIAGLKADPAFSGQLLPLAQQLAALNSNPWIRHIDSDAQGYAVMTVTPTQLQCQFKKVNRLVGSAAPSSVVAKVTSVTLPKDSTSVTVA